MEEENSNLERECHALAVLFQHIVEETKVRQTQSFLLRKCPNVLMEKCHATLLQKFFDTNPKLTFLVLQNNSLEKKNEKSVTLP